MQMGLDRCTRYAEVNHFAIYGFFLNIAIAKIDFFKETDRYKRYIVIYGIVISGQHCTAKMTDHLTRQNRYPCPSSFSMDS